MITGYEIKKEEKEEILILHLNYDYEFSLEFHKRKQGKSMKRQIDDYLKKEHITWNGDKIILMFGGIALGTLLLINHPIDQNRNNYAYVSDTILPIEETTKNSFEEIEVLEELELKEEQSESESQTSLENSKNQISESNASIENKTQQSTTKQQETTKQETIIPINQEMQQETQSIQSTGSDTTTSIENQQEIPVDASSERKVTIHRTNGTVVTMGMTEYLIGVVAAEMPASFPLEALKAQSVVARTYAMKKIESGGILTDSISTQVYKDQNQLKELWGSSYNTYYQKIRQAVEGTDQIVIRYQGTLIEALYHSTSNGKTEDAVNVWGNDVPYLKSVDSHWDQSASSYLRMEEKELTTVLTILGIDFDNFKEFEILSRNESGRISSIRVGNNSYSGVEFRNLLGLRSADFDIEIVDGILKITTRGYGHGVGMSQYGAKGMAEAGYNYREILQHYYQNTQVST